MLNEYARPVAICGLAQTTAILIATAAANLGTGLQQRGGWRGSPADWIEHFGLLLTSYGWFLLLIPLAWTGIGMFLITRDRLGGMPRMVMSTGWILALSFSLLILLMLTRVLGVGGGGSM